MAGGTSKNDVIVVDDDSSDEDVAVVLSSKAVPSIKQEKAPRIKQEKTVEADVKPQAATGSAPFSKEERAALEAARLERNRKRRREQGLPSDDEAEAPPRKVTGEVVATPRMPALSHGTPSSSPVDIGGSSGAAKALAAAGLTGSGRAGAGAPDDPLLGNMIGSAASDIKPQASSSAAPASSSIYSRIRPGERFWHGAVKHSANRLAPTSKAGVPLSDFVLPTTPFNANGLRQAILCSFSTDIKWLIPVFPRDKPISEGGSAPDLTLITHLPGQPGVQRPHPQLPNWRILAPPLYSNYCTMHMKFMILVYDTHLRFVLTSGNFEECDWSFIENSAYIQDFPHRRRPLPSVPPQNPDSDFQEHLEYTLRGLTVPAGHPIFAALNDYDLTRTEIRLVASIATSGAQAGWKAIADNGIGRLSDVVLDIGAPVVEGGFVVESQGSSSGSYDMRWLKHFHIIASGHDIQRHCPLPSGKQENAALAYDRIISGNPSLNTKYPDVKKTWPTKMRIIFPTERFVMSEYQLGPDGAGSFYGKQEHVEANGYRHLFYLPKSKRAPTLMHSKTILALPAAATDSPAKFAKQGKPDDVVGWSYMGSHNFTPAAWGRLSGDNRKPSIFVNNYELGLVFPIRRRDVALPLEQQPAAMQVLMYKHPLEPYRADDLPFDQAEYAKQLQGQIHSAFGGTNGAGA